jgi:hypothetical protein
MHTDAAVHNSIDERNENIFTKSSAGNSDRSGDADIRLL